MPERNKIFQQQTRTGDPISIKSEQGTSFEVTPQAQALILRWPHGGLVWNRPMAILVKNHEQADLPPTRVPIVDVTRIAQGILLGLSVIFTVISVTASIKSKLLIRRKQNE